LRLAKDRVAGINDESDRKRLERILYKDQVRKIKSKRRRKRKLDNEHKDNKGELKGFWNPKEAGQNKTQKLDDKNFYDSWQWADLRFQILKKYGAKCMLCGSKNDIQVDHIKPRSLYPKLALDPSNLQVLCAPCNKGKSNKDTSDFRPS